MGWLSHPETWWSQEDTVISNFRWATSKAHNMLLKNVTGKYWEVSFLSRRHYSSYQQSYYFAMLLPGNDCQSLQCWTAAAHSNIAMSYERCRGGFIFFPPLPCSVLACPLLSASLLAEMRPSRHLAGGSGTGTHCLFGYRRLLQLHTSMLAFLAAWPSLLFPLLSPSDLIISVSYSFCYTTITPLCLFCL